MPDGYHHDEGRRLLELASNKSVSFKLTKHAEEEMAKDGIALLDLRSMLKRCSVVKVESHRYEETWNAEGTDQDGRRMTAVVVAYEDQIKVKVVTAWAHRR